MGRSKPRLAVVPDPPPRSLFPPDDLRTLRASWDLHLDSCNLAKTTIGNYLRTLDQFLEFLNHKGMTTRAPELTTTDVNRFRIAVRDRASAQTSNTYRAHLLQLWNWLTSEDERICESNIVAATVPMKVDEPVVPVIPPDWLHRLRADTAGRSFIDLRDRAIISVLIDAGPRRSEVATMNLDDLPADLRKGLVMGKGGKQRYLPLGRTARRDVDRYLRARMSHIYADEPALWLGARGPLTGDGIYQMLERRCRRVGIRTTSPHKFRHTFAHLWKLGGGSDSELAHIAGWETQQMAARYGKSAAGERAREAHARLSPLDNL